MTHTHTHSLWTTNCLLSTLQPQMRFCCSCLNNVLATPKHTPATHANTHTHPYTDMICKQSPSTASVTAIRFCLLVFTETFSFRKDHCFCCCLLEIQSSNLFISLLKVSASMRFCVRLFCLTRLNDF